MEINKEQLKVADLFAGAGGLAVGFHQAGYKTIFFNEIHQPAAETFSANFPDAYPYVCPIEELDGKKIRKQLSLNLESLDVMVGGPPCQGFSINAPERSEKDPRNHLFKHYVRLVLEGIKPKFIVMENVPGLISIDNGKFFNNILQAFKESGYNVIFKILNASHYGVPQERWRLIIIGSRIKGIPLSFPSPRHYSFQRPNFTGGREFTFTSAIGKPTHNDLFSSALLPPVGIQDAIGDLPRIESGGGSDEMPYDKKPLNEYQRFMRRGAGSLFNHHTAGLSHVNLERIEHVKPGGSWRDIPEELLPAGLKKARRSDHTKRYGRLNPEKPSTTIMTKCDPHWGTFIHYNQDRIISVREAARIQSFPDWFRFTGNKIEQYRQVGNAVPPLLAYAIASHIKHLLKPSKSVPNKKEDSLVYA